MNDEHWELDRARVAKEDYAGEEVDNRQIADAGSDEARDAHGGFNKDYDHTGADKGHTLTEKAEKREDGVDAISDASERLVDGEEGTVESDRATSEKSMNPMIMQLNNEAKLKARQFIKRNFQDPMDLDEASALRIQLQKQAAVAGSQLNGAVQSKLEALKRAADLMDESSLKLGELSNTMRDVDKRIAESNTAISQYQNLRRVHHVRDNVDKVIAQIDVFARVPEKVEALKDIIATDPTRIRYAYLECLRLEAPAYCAP